MAVASTFDEVLEAVGQLSLEDQESLMGILERRQRELRRAEIVRSAKEAEAEYKAGKCRVASPDEIMAEILS